MLKKLLALLLAGLLCVGGLTAPVFATNDEDNDGYSDDDDDDDDDDGRLQSIRLSNSSIRMVVGDDDMRLTVRFTPTGAAEGLEWWSSEEDVATVDMDGNVTAVAEGRAVIHVESESGESDSCIVEVREKGDRYDEVEEVEMNIRELTVRKGQTRQLIAYVSPSNLEPEDEELYWTSDDVAVASVEQDGTVTGVALGSATITARAGNGEEDTCRVTVVAANASIADEDGERITNATAASSTSTTVGALTSANVRSTVQRVADATSNSKVGMAAFSDSGVITPELMTAAASAAGGKTVTMRFATTSALTKKRMAYLTLDPKVGRNLKNNVNTGVLVDGKEVDAAEATFDKYYQNETAALYLAQPGSYGMTVTVQALADLTGMDTKNLVFYSYADNEVTKLAVTTYGVDANGFLSFSTTVGGVIIVSDGALVR